MKPDTNILKSVWKESKHIFSDKNVEMERLKLDRLISSFFSNGPFYYYVIDFATMTLSHVSQSIEELHGLDPDNVTFQDILDQIHPDDMEFVSKAERKCIEMIFGKIPQEKRKNYKMSYCFRFRTADASYQMFNHQAIILTTDERGQVSKSLNIHTNINHLTNQNNYKVSVIGMMGEPSFLNLDVGAATIPLAPSKAIFSGREMEVIHLISQGLTTAEIAKELGIAENTVKNHRKNILRKSACNNSGQLIAKCITEGLL